MLKRLNPETVAPPFSPYSLAVEVPAGARTLHISGQVGIDREGRLAEGAEAQIELSLRNVLAIAEAAGMGPADLVKLTVFLTRAEDVPLLRRVRGRVLGGAEPASTLLLVSGLASPEWLVEIEAVAAKA